MDVLLVCKPSGRNAMAIFLILASFVALSVMWVYEGIEDPVCLWMLLLSVPMTVLFFFLFRFQFVGEEQLGIDGKDFVMRVVKKFPFQKDLRIPLADIAEIRYNSKSKMREITEAMAELRGRAIDENGIVLVTIYGKRYRFGKDLTEKQVERFRERFYEYMMSKDMDVNLNELYK
ncbi:MAG: hypothetical protein J6P65_06540 [Bacteroidales bacterium]|nr:hypothetical protein [Bacteroidales bacterium]